MGKRKIANPLAAALRVELAGEFLQGPALDFRQALVGLFDQVVQRPKRDGRHRVGTGTPGSDFEY